MQLNIKHLSGIFAALALMMLATRYNHFGSAVSLPDASLAVFLLAGFLLARQILPALLAFILLILEAGAIDYYATQIQGVSDWCITPAYGFLIPTYATMWFAGRWLGKREFNNLSSLGLFGGISLLATSAAFVISNISFFLLAGNFSDMTAIEYANRVQQYYAPYLSGSLIYLSCAVVIYMALMAMTKNSVNVVKN